MSNDQAVQKALKDYLEGHTTHRDLHQSLAHIAHFDLKSERRRVIEFIAPLNCEVEVEISHLVLQLEKYLQGQLAEDDLVLWATHLSLMDVYVSPGWQDDEIADQYAPMWDALQQLSIPSVHGEIHPEYILQLLQKFKPS